MTVPTQTALEVPGTGLGGALGLGIQQGGQLGLQSLLKRYADAQKGMTEYQQIQTKLREKEQLRKMESGVTQTLLKLAEEDVIQDQNIIPMAKNVSDLIRKGLNPAEALQQGVSDFQFQSAALDDLKIGKYKTSKAESLKKEIIDSLKKENITNPTLINRTLKGKNWPTKERQDILKRLKGMVTEKKADIPQVTDVTEPKKGKLKQLSKQELSARYAKMPGNSHKKKLENLKKTLAQEGYSIQGL